MTELTFHTLDVFTDRPFSGNPLAVIPEAPELDAAVMQAIAREFNLSETVFVRPADAAGAARRLRIFTPAEELPFAGHPTIGTAQLLVELGLVRPGADGTVEFALEEGVGLVPVSVAVAPDGAGFTWLTAARLPERGPPPQPRDVLAPLLGIAPDDVLDDDRDAPATYSAGVAFTFVPLRDRVALARARVDAALWKRALAGTRAQGLFLFCYAGPGSGGDSAPGPGARRAPDLHARMFAPAMGIVEDAATGSAAAALVGYLWERDLHGPRRSAPGDAGTRRWIIAQGEDMGRPSTLHAEAVAAGGRLQAARVGGSAVRMSRGTLTVR